MPKFTFLKEDQTVELKEGTELKRISVLYPSLPLRFGCRQGDCGTCAIKVVTGEQNLSPLTKQERITLQRLGLTSHRLACQCALIGDVTIDS